MEGRRPVHPQQADGPGAVTLFILPAGEQSLTQDPTAGSWQEGDLNTDLKALLLSLCCMYLLNAVSRGLCPALERVFCLGGRVPGLTQSCSVTIRPVRGTVDPEPCV